MTLLEFYLYVKSIIKKPGKKRQNYHHFLNHSRARSVPKMFANNADDILARSTVETWVIKGEKGDADVCRKCCGKVYEAEKMTSAAVSFHVIKA